MANINDLNTHSIVTWFLLKHNGVSGRWISEKDFQFLENKLRLISHESQSVHDIFNTDPRGNMVSDDENIHTPTSTITGLEQDLENLEVEEYEDPLQKSLKNKPFLAKYSKFEEALKGSGAAIRRALIMCLNSSTQTKFDQNLIKLKSKFDAVKGAGLLGERQTKFDFMLSQLGILKSNLP